MTREEIEGRLSRLVCGGPLTEMQVANVADEVETILREGQGLTPAEKKVAATLMAMASDQFSNHGCNDFQLKRARLTMDERREVMAKFQEWLDPEANFEPDSYIQDDMLMRFMAERLIG